MKKSVLIVSGGIDSITMLYEYQSEIAMAISFNYGSLHNDMELSFAKHHCKLLGIRHIVVDLPFVGELFSSSLLKNGSCNCQDNDGFGSGCNTVVPFRNGIMLSIACGIADSNGLANIMFACNSCDVENYPDCRVQFVEKMSEACSRGTDGHVSVSAPYLGKSKAEIIAAGQKIGVDYSATYSCYKGGEVHCGQCLACNVRKNAFRIADIPDPTLYQI